MAIERQPATPVDGLIEQDPEEADISIAIENPESVAIETDDGGMSIDFDHNASPVGDEGFESNLADFMDDDVLREMGNELGSDDNVEKE